MIQLGNHCSYWQRRVAPQWVWPPHFLWGTHTSSCYCWEYWPIQTHRPKYQTFCQVWWWECGLLLWCRKWSRPEELMYQSLATRSQVSSKVALWIWRMVRMSYQPSLYSRLSDIWDHLYRSRWRRQLREEILHPGLVGTSRLDEEDVRK